MPRAITTMSKNQSTSRSAIYDKDVLFILKQDNGGDGPYAPRSKKYNLRTALESRSYNLLSYLSWGMFDSGMLKWIDALSILLQS